MTLLATPRVRDKTSDLAPKEAFYALADRILAECHAGENISLYFEGENTDFVRFTRARVRQPGHVKQGFVSLRLASGAKSAEAKSALSGMLEEDTLQMRRLLQALRSQVSVLPDDPYLSFPAAGEEGSSNSEEDNELPSGARIVEDILGAAEGDDLVGILAAGGVFAGFASSTGQRNWFARYPVHIDFSLQLEGDRAIKDAYAGRRWDAKEFAGKVSRMKKELALLRRAPRKIAPGSYRAYLAPAALDEVFQVLAWGGAFGLGAWETKESCLVRLHDPQVSLSRHVDILEHNADGFGPGFNAQGFMKPGCIKLIEGGHRRQSLVSSRSSLEYGVPCTGAEADEEPCALEMSGGELADEDVLTALGTGLYVSNLWYLNHSDRQGGRMTGMTRFGTFWVEQGEIVAPIQVMRFDDTLFRMLGSELEALSARRQRFMDTRSYGARSTKSSLLPGALLRSFSFTL